MNNDLTLIAERLESRRTLQALRPKKIWDVALDGQIAALPLMTSATPSDHRPLLIALKAGLHLLNESLDASHAYAQEIEDDATGCYWHGILHRMEGDFSNADYWVQMAGAHPAKQRLQERVVDWVQNSTILSDLPAGEIGDGIAAISRQGRWNPASFTFMVALQESGSASEETRGALEFIQHLELLELFAHTRHAALQALT